MPTESSILQISIAGNWTVDEMRNILSSFDELYSIRYLWNLIGDLDFPALYHGGLSTIVQRDRLTPLLAREERLRIYQIEFASPGFIKILLEHSIGRLFEHFFLTESQRLSNEEKREDIRGKRLDNEFREYRNASKYLAIRQEFPEMGPELRNLVNRTEKLFHPISIAIEEHRVTGIELLEDR